MAKLSRSKQNILIDKEINKILNLVNELPEDKKELATRLIERIAFMTITLKELEEDIKLKGPTYLFEQGLQKMIVINPSQKVYNTLINRYTVAYDKLLNLLPKDLIEQEDDFDRFLNSR